MKKKIYILTSIVVIFLLLLYLNFQYSNYYSSPLESLIRDYNSDAKFKKEIEVFSIGNNPLIFYLSQQNNIRLAHFKVRKFGGEVKYKVSKVTRYKMNIENVVFQKSYNTSDIFVKEQKTGAERILFGILTPSKSANIQINGKKPIIKNFKLGEKAYALWYITGGVELDRINSSILNE